MRFLSDEWLAAADTAISGAAGSAPNRGLTVDQHIDGVISYRIVVARDGAGVARLDAAVPSERPDAAFHQSEATARSIARRETDAHQGFLLGKIRFEGDIDVLIERRDAFAWLEMTLAPLMARTTF